MREHAKTNNFFPDSVAVKRGVFRSVIELFVASDSSTLCVLPHVFELIATACVRFACLPLCILPAAQIQMYIPAR